MKISKLFHWLYAIVMLLPVFAIGTTCLIGIFNENAYTTKEVIYENTNVINSSDDIVDANYYYINCAGTLGNYQLYIEDDEYIQLDFYYLDYLDFSNYTPYITLYDIVLNDNEIYFPKVIFSLYIDSHSEAYYYTPNGDDYFSIYIGNLNDEQFLLKGVFKFYYYGEFTYTSNLFSECPQEKLPIREVVEKDTYDIFYYSVDKVVDSPLFNWAFNSFLVTPFSYIANVFSMPVNSPIVMLLSYWLAISVVWLVFDLIMYVPLLVHSWIDRGMVK